MTPDSQYQNLNFELSQIKHHYGNNIHLLKDPYLLTLLEKIGHTNTTQPLLTEYVKKAYNHLFMQIAASEFVKQKVCSHTRMIEHHSEGIYDGEIIDQNIKVVCVDLARAGMIPSQLIYSELNYLLNPKNIRQDHFYAARTVNQKGEVIGVDISGSKIGGDVDDAYVILPDPMGATGGTISEAIKHYKEKVKGKAKKYITAHLIITPEYIQRIQKEHPDVVVFSIRLDRGLSDAKALLSEPGEFPELERGLNHHQYIVPGAGGVGELLNNSFV
jgi:uracil phosphoribosyltransferase